MNTSEQILVIILSTFLAIFLLLGIIVLVKVIQIIDKIQALTEKTEQVIEKAGAITSMLGKTSLVGALIRFFAHGAKSYRKSK